MIQAQDKPAVLTVDDGMRIGWLFKMAVLAEGYAARGAVSGGRVA